VYLTAEGKQLKRRAADLPRQLLGKTKLSATELKQLRACLQGLTKTLHDNAD
jgi:hypothetical protein